MKNVVSVQAVKCKRTNRKRRVKFADLKKPSISEYEQIILNLANKHGLGSIHKESLERWFKLIQYFADRHEPASNILLWYQAGKEESIEKLIAGGLEHSDTVKYEKIRVEEVRKLQREIGY